MKINPKILSLLVIPALGPLSASAQDVVKKAKTTTVEVPDSYWEDASDNNSYVMNEYDFTDNWFIGIQAGSMMSWNSNSKNNSFMGNQNAALGVQFGKWLIPYMGFRLTGIYGHNSSKLLDPELSYHWQTWGFSYDLLLDFSNLFFHYKENRFFNVQGSIGVGMNHASRFTPQDERITAPKPNFFNARVGLALNFRLAPKLDLNVEIVNNWLNSDFDGRPVNNRYDGHADIMVGLIYHFKNKNGTRMFTYAKYNASRYEQLNEQADALRAQVEGSKQAPENSTATSGSSEAGSVTSFRESNQITEIARTLVRTFVTFPDQKADIPQDQIANIQAAALNYKKQSNAAVYILPNNHSQPTKNRDLFVQRANAIKYKLMNDFFVPAGDIFVEFDPKIVLNLSQKNSMIIYVNE